MTPISALSVTAVFTFAFLECDANENGFINLASDLLPRRNHFNDPIGNFQTEDGSSFGDILDSFVTVQRVPTVISDIRRTYDQVAQSKWPWRSNPHWAFPKPFPIQPYIARNNEIPYLIRFKINEDIEDKLKQAANYKSRERMNNFVWYPMRRGFLQTRRLEDTNRDKSAPTNEINGWWLMEEKSTTALPPNFTRLKNRRSTPQVLPNILESLGSKKSYFRTDQLGNTITRRFLGDVSSTWLGHMVKCFHPVPVQGDETDLLSRNFFSFGKQGKPLILLRSSKPSLNVLGDRNWFLKKGESPYDRFLLLIKQSNLPAQDGIGQYSDHPGDYYSLSNKQIVRQWPRIKATWFARLSRNYGLNQLEELPRKNSSFDVNLFSNSWLRQLIQNSKHNNLAGRLRNTWFRRGFLPASKEDDIMDNVSSNASVRTGRYRRSVTNKKKRVSNRLKSIWLIVPKQ